jgi:hypothetical protein
MEQSTPKKYYQKTWFKVAAGACVGLWALIALVSGDKPKDASKDAVQAEEAKPVEATKVSATTLYSDYEANEVAADEKYKGKVLEVSGTINSIGKDILNTPYVALTTNNVISTVQCMFEKSEADKLVELKKNTKITVHGEIQGKLGNIVLKNCEIVK